MLLISIILSIPAIQTKLGSYATKKLNEDFNTNISVEKIDLSFLGNVQLKGVDIRDHHKDTLIFVKKLTTSILNAKKVLESEVSLGSISLDGAYVYMKTYKGEKDDSMAVFIDSFDDGSPKDSLANPFILKSSNVYVSDLNYKLINENSNNPILFSASNGGGNLQDLLVYGPDFSSKIRGLYFVDNRDLEVTNLTTDFSYSKTAMHFVNTTLQTRKSDINANIDFTYKREDLVDFNNKVNITATFAKSNIAIPDLKKYYNELNGNDDISFTGDFKGKLNNFALNKLRLTSRKGIRVIGNLGFVNAVNFEKGFIFRGDLSDLTATYSELKSVLPNVLGKTLPSEFAKFGKFTIKGKINVTRKEIKANLDLKSEIGGAITDLQISNIDDIDYAAYSGKVALQKFNIGELFNDPLFGEVSLKGDVKGSGFKLENINTSFVGTISGLNFKGYNYKNIEANGQYQNNKFDGDLKIDDANFKMNFNGLADLSTEINKFDFKSNIEYLNLKETNLFTRDSIAILKGNIELDVEGNTFDDITGKATFKNILYTNQKEEFNFKEFNVTSSLKDSIKTIEVASKDIAEGYLSGKFSFSELLPVAQNALGSIYTNYTPYAVKPNQFLDFNFTIYNQIVTVFFPDISIDDNTKIKGKIKADKNQLRLTFSSPKIEGYGNEIKDILLRTDNQNPLYNSHLTASEVNTKYYNISKLNLLSLNQNDTLYFKSVFKGGDLKNEDFNLDFFYTFNPEGKSVVGFEKSSFIFKENTWNIDPNEQSKNKVTFNIKENDFDFSQFKLTSGEQEIEFSGSLKGESEKILLADFTKVKLQSFLPKIDSLALKGELSGHLDFVQNKGIYSPEALLSIHDFEVNNFKQGDLSLNVKGDNSYEKYKVDLSINNKKVKSIAATGSLDFSEKRPLIDLDVYLEEFGLDAFSPLGQDVLSSIRGTANGDFSLRGFLGNPEMEGTLTLKNAGLKFPYLNVDYDFEGESIISLQDQSFIFEGISLIDTKHKSSGRLIGDITHLNFKKWFLNIEIESDNLLVLDTKNTDEALYYGTAFIDGTANITGLTDQLTIDINAKTMPGTAFVVPLKDVETVDSYRLIHFKSKEIAVKEKQKEVALEAIKGLSLNIDLDVTKDATAQVVIDEVNGSQLTGKGKGNLRIEINTRGKFNMFGDYMIDSGVYDFKYGGIVNKPFLIQKGGTVSWNGNPYEANLDVTAIYKAKANPAVLLDNFNSNRKIEVDLVTRITGGLFSSKQELDIQLSNVDPSIASELEFILNDNNVNEKTTQFISLLAFGSFANPDKVDFNAGETISNTASSAVAAAFSSLLNNPDGKFQLGVDYQQGNSGSDIESLNTDNQVDVSVSTQLGDKVIINGKVGVPVGTQTQSSVVGEVKVEVLLNKEGNFRGVIFNRQNEIQYSTEEEGYTQGVGLSYQVNFNSLSGLLRKIRGKKSVIRRTQAQVKKDSIFKLKDNLINFEGN
ncbi:translocation/assembly module TamB domain-containing protein [Polaribacter sp. Z014]|uniref:translocation/assembly module TamB domain-containing protein n=1 Tax=Polaribacter sp. Z014 TaxID=2927126 RepID=UPI002021389A|nr:translocation/assembly module TamB [Polaribacter sp. Z014]MCL7765235.1 translocation/assembly module TamB domain-containing protein [Polaribacter sp. Z014]